MHDILNTTPPRRGLGATTITAVITTSTTTCAEPRICGAPQSHHGLNLATHGMQHLGGLVPCGSWTAAVRVSNNALKQTVR